MKDRTLLAVPIALVLVLSIGSRRLSGQTIQDPPVGRPDAVVDLGTSEGVELVKSQWRYHGVRIVDADSRAPGPDLKPSGQPIKTYDYTPHAAQPISMTRSGR